MLGHHWPGNVRELKNAIERATLLSGGAPIQPEHLPPEVASAEPSSSRTSAALAADGNTPTVVMPVGSTMEDTEREMIRSTLMHTSGNKTRAAKMLDISLKTMHNKVKKFGL